MSTVVIKGYGAVIVRDEEELRRIRKVKTLIEENKVESCRELLSTLETLRWRKRLLLAKILDEKLHGVIARNECPDLE